MTIVLLTFFLPIRVLAQATGELGADGHSVDSDACELIDGMIDVSAETAEAMRSTDRASYRAPRITNRYRNMVYLDCSEGSMHVLRRLRRRERGSVRMPGSDGWYRCERGHDSGAVVDREFQEQGFPTLNACVRTIAGAGETEPDRIQIGHGGVHNRRRSSNGRWSLHSYGRAMDIQEVWVGETRYNYIEARRHQDGPEWTQFWEPLVRCLQARGFAALWEDRNHIGHLHFSLPYREGDRRPRRNMNDM